jgi:hypothetical protein
MKEQYGIIKFFESPFYQAGLISLCILLLTLFDKAMPHDTTIIKPGAGPWIVATALLLCYVFFNTVFLFRMKETIPYWSKSMIAYVLLLVLTYGWCFFLSGHHIDEVGSFRWLWMVLTLVYMVFFAIAYTIKGIVAIADREDRNSR